MDTVFYLWFLLYMLYHSRFVFLSLPILFNRGYLISLVKIPANDRDLYQFLYVSCGNHVVGVSMPFKITDEEELPDLCIATLFKEPSLLFKLEKSRARKGMFKCIYIYI